MKGLLNLYQNLSNKSLIKKIALLFILLPLMSVGNEVQIMSEKELKVCNSYFSNGTKEFTGSYLDGYIDGQYHEWREGEWMFWYPDGQIKFKGYYKSGELLTESCWKSNGDSVSCELLNLSEQDKQRIFKKIVLSNS